MIAADWMESLSVFPKACVEKACAWWRDNETRKPKPADIRKLAIQHFGEVEWEKLMRLRALADLPVTDKPAGKPGAPEVYQKPTEEQKAKVREMVNSIQRVNA
jgi:hypothetical protein